MGEGMSAVLYTSSQAMMFVYGRLTVDADNFDSQVKMDFLIQGLKAFSVAYIEFTLNSWFAIVKHPVCLLFWKKHFFSPYDLRFVITERSTLINICKQNCWTDELIPINTCS